MRPVTVSFPAKARAAARWEASQGEKAQSPDFQPRSWSKMKGEPKETSVPVPANAARARRSSTDS